jgi:hypothetical protein
MEWRDTVLWSTDSGERIVELLARRRRRRAGARRPIAPARAAAGQQRRELARSPAEHLGTLD